MASCNSNQQKLCGRLECNVCFERSFASYEGKTPDGKKKVDCWYNPKLCEDDRYDFCYNNSFASYEGKTPDGKKKVDCWSDENNEKT